MKIILVENMKHVGKAGDVVKVADGYARNYLLPRNFAIFASPANLKKVEEIKKEAQLKELEAENKLKAIAAKVEGLTLNFAKKADENGHLFGSVTEYDISNALKEKEFDINKNLISLDNHIKELGDFEVEIKFNSSIKAKIKVSVTGE
ncbi:MAG: 50S ribosomal protein L9 [Candidatus Cloacimonetes bacterium]|nr:50S ribosomal protein L9 [Candidatus Cloacimonadota bacterium]